MRKLSTFCLFTFLALPAFAARYGDVEVTPVPGETAQTGHGYAPYRFRVRNNGQNPARVGVSLGRNTSFGGLSSLIREVDVPAHAGVEVVLYQPAETLYTGQASVIVDGRRQQDPLPVTSLDHGPRGHGGGGRFMLTSNRLATEERDALIDDASGVAGRQGACLNATAAQPVAEWPTDWLSYSRWDAVALTRDEFESAPPGVRAALEGYVRSGGQLVVLRAGAKAVPAAWKDAEVGDAGPIVSCHLGFGRAWFIPQEATDSAKSSLRWGLFNTANSPENPAHKTPDCAAVASGQVPVRGMFLLMLAFAVLVGPVNYVWCARKNRRTWMLWTSPAIAGVFVVGVFAYALLSDGVRPWGRTVAVTLLDEKAHSAVTLGSTSWYAPMMPSDGLRFGAMTEVRAPRNDGGMGDQRTDMGVVQGSSQWLTGGWMVPRVPESFGYRKVTNSRERMTIEKDADGSWSAVNSLGVAVDAFEVHGATRLHCGAIPVGGRAKLLPGPGALAEVPVLYAHSGPQWQARLGAPLFAETPFADAKSHEVTETVIGRMEEPLK